MRELSSQQITEVVKKLCIEANCHQPQAREILSRIIENYEIADAQNQLICQDTGVACVFLKIG